MGRAGILLGLGLLAACSSDKGVGFDENVSTYATLGCAAMFQDEAARADTARKARLTALSEGFVAAGMAHYRISEQKMRAEMRPFAEEMASDDLSDPILAEERVKMIGECMDLANRLPQTRPHVGDV